VTFRQNLNLASTTNLSDCSCGTSQDSRDSMQCLKCTCVVHLVLTIWSRLHHRLLIQRPSHHLIDHQMEKNNSIKCWLWIRHQYSLLVGSKQIWPHWQRTSLKSPNEEISLRICQNEWVLWFNAVFSQRK